jgi:hypothetical protein
MADATRVHLQKNFAVLGNRTREFFERKSLAEFVEDCCAHQRPFFVIDVTNVTSRSLSYTVNYNRKRRVRSLFERNSWDEGRVQRSSSVDLCDMLDIRVRDFLASVRKPFNFLFSGDSAPVLIGI